MVEDPKSSQSSLILKTQKSNSKTNLSELGLQKHSSGTYPQKDPNETKS